MFPQFYGNNVNQGEQSQGNQIKRQDQGYRPDIPRQQQMQGVYPSVNMNPGVAVQQYDTRFMGNVNPVMNPNSGVPYTMIPNMYGDGMKSAQMQYDRGLMNYSMPVQMVGMQPGTYNNINPYFPYYGYRQGIPVQNMERSLVPGYNMEYPPQQTQEKVSPPSQSVTPQLPQQSTQPAVVMKQDGNTEGNAGNKQPAAQAPSIKTESEPVKEPADLPQKKEEPAPSTTQKVSNDMVDDIQLATMLLQIKGKAKESFAANSAPSQMNEVGVNNLLANRVYTHPAPSLPKPEDKRPHIENPYDLSNYMMYPGYSMQSMQSMQSMPYNTMKQPYPAPYSVPQTRYQNYYPPQTTTPQPQPTPSLPQPSQPIAPPPIPSPAPLHKTANPLPVGDYYVFCTVCRHGTPISINNPIPDIFKCANCGFTCQLDKHLLSYYNYTLPVGNKTEQAEDVQVKSEDAQDVQVKSEDVGNIQVKSEDVENVQVKSEDVENIQVKSEDVENVQVKSEDVQVKSEDVQVKSEPIQVKNEEAIEETVGQVAETINPPPAQPSSIHIDMVVLSSVEQTFPKELLLQLGSRGEYSEESEEQELTHSDMKDLQQQCCSQSNEWWIGKFILLEVPASLVNEDQPEVSEKMTILGEVVGISEVGFVIRLIEGDGKKTVNIETIISKDNKCWVILKEGYKNLRVC